MSDKDLNLKKDKFYIKVKRYNKEGPLAMKEFIYSNLNNYELVNEKIKEAIFNLRRKKTPTEDHIVVLVLNHPKYKEIYFDSKEEWDLLFKYNIIEECINNDSLYLGFMIYEKNNENYISLKKTNKKSIIKYIIQNLPINSFFNFFINFLNKKNILKEFEESFINYLIPNNSDKKNEENNTTENKNEKYKEYLMKNNEIIIDTLNKKFERIEKNEKSLKSFIRIQNIIKDDKKNENINKIDNNSKTHLNFTSNHPRTSMDKLFDDSSINNDNEILKTALNPPDDYVKKLMDNNNFFRKIEENEYYNGLEKYKDQLIRESMDALKYTNK
jgi:hypothetical protein